jgi:ppGpp synthetase/RelA/SpoT-type nucleotidyltranferase
MYVGTVSELRALRDDWVRERPVFEGLSKHVAAFLQGAVTRRGIVCRTESRAKAVSSLVKKAIRDGYTRLQQIPDKAGARVILVFADTLPEVREVVRHAFLVFKEEDKSESLGPKVLDYLGVHFDIGLKPDDQAFGSFGDRRCEVQLHTTAQRAWADVSHELLYKASLEPPPALSRKVYRLMALMEIFDESVIDSRDTLRRMMGWLEAEVLREVERPFLEMTARDYDRELSLVVLPALVRAHQTDDAETIVDRVRRFVLGNRDRIQRVFDEYADDARHPLLFQPEALAVFERLDADPFVLKDEWSRILSVDLLENLAEVWGVPL